MEHRLSSGALEAVVKADGAELISLKDASGLEYVWQAGPQWPRHAPVLFPIVGRLRDDSLVHEGQSYPMKQHGFARDMRFFWIEGGPPNSCRLMLRDNEATRAQFPFAFRLEISYALAGDSLRARYDVFNPGEDFLPASIGAHPAFNWPLEPGRAKDEYALLFDAEETAPVRRLEAGLMREAPEPCPVEGRVLNLRESLFAEDAVIFTEINSRSARYGAPGGRSVEIAWSGFPELGLWSKPGADFLCVEPWSGYASPANFDGPFYRKPGLSLIPPGAKRSAQMTIRLLPAEATP
ncbi:aldose 1-epimerase family protein [Methylocella sp.]|uniref:aldose 1-epimerase family protein n=1 Tax=Methylocella sp. TaxID=1978226 RepID=UPI003782D986